MEKERISSTAKKMLPIILATSIFMQMLESTILNTSLPTIAAELNESPLKMQNAIISYVLTLAIFMPVSGFLADKFGTKKIFILSLVLFSLGSVLCAFSQNLDHLVIARVIQGIGGSMMTPVGKLALIKSYDKSEIIHAMNYAIIPALIGPVLGPLVGGYLVDYLSWHWIFLINLPIGILGIILTIKYMPDYKSKTVKFDLKGFLIFSIASLMISVALEMIGNTPSTTPVLLVFIFGFLMLYYYFKHAQKETHPIFPLNLFQIRTFRVGILGNLATRLGISSISLLVPLMVQLAYKESAVLSGWIVAPMALTAMFGKSYVIKILNKYGYRKTLLVNTIVLGILICLMAIPNEQSSVYTFIPILALMGFFNSIQFTSMNTISISDLRQFQESSGNSLISVNQQLAMGFGIAFGLLVLNFFQHTDIVLNTNTHNAFRYTFLVMGIITLLSSLVFLRLHISDGKNMQTDK